MKKLHLCLFLLLAASLPLPAQDSSAEGNAWYATWKSGLAEAKRTGRPILLVSAAPHCHQVSGIW